MYIQHEKTFDRKNNGDDQEELRGPTGMSWEIKKLETIADFCLGKMLDQKKNRGEHLSYLANINVRWGEFDLADLREMRFEQHELDRYGLKYGDIVMCEGGEPGRCAIWKDQRSCMMIQKALHRIRPHNCLKPEFLYYFFLHKGRTGYLSPLFTGATIKHLPREKLALVEVPIPPQSTQDYIVSVLCAYDDLIENNRRRIQLLEQSARLLYKEWFVRFRFPGHEHTKIINGLPEGWEKKKVSELIKRIPAGKLYEQKSAFVDGLVPILDQGKSGLIGFHNDDPSVMATQDAPVIVFANHTCYQRIVHYPFSAIQNVLPFIPTPKLACNIYWLHYATDGLVKLNAYKGHWPEFMAKVTLLPPFRLCKQFGQIVRDNHLMMDRLDDQNKRLTKARDLLLPKLMNGEVAA